MISEINLKQNFYQIMIWFGKSFIKFCKSFINLIKLVSTRTCSSARVRNDLDSQSDGYESVEGQEVSDWKEF